MKVLWGVLIATASLFANVAHIQKLYTQKSYHEVMKEAKEFKSDYGNIHLHLMWARSAKALGQDLEAMLAYERVLILDPAHIEAQKELVEIYMALKKYKLALAINQKLKKEDLAFEVKEIIHKVESKSTFETSFNLALGYDSNVNVHHESDELDIFFDSANHTEKLSSIFYRATPTIEYLREFDNHLYFKTSFNGYYKMVSQESDYSIYLNTLNIGLGYYQGNYNFSLPLSYTLMSYLGEDYLRIASMNPQIDYKVSNDFIVSLNSKFEKRSFKTDADRDDKSIALGLNAYQKIKNGYLFVDIEYQHYSSESENYQDFSNKKSYGATMGIGYTFANEIKAVASYRVAFGEYEDNIGTELNPKSELRSDTYYQFNLKLSKQLSQKSALVIENEYSINESNFIPADYSRNTLLVGFELSY